MINRLIIILAVLIFSVNCYAAGDQINFVTYGSDAPQKEGDDDYTQIFFILIDSSEAGVHDLELYDIDCSGKNDMKYGEFNSQFAFQLYGGAGIYSPATCRQPYPGSDLINTGKLIWSAIIESNENYDDKWIKAASLDTKLAEFYNGMFVFKLVVKGTSGNDANVYNLRVDGTAKNEKISIVNYAPTIRLPQQNYSIHLVFDSPEANVLNIANFDAEGTPVKLTTPFRSNLDLTSSAEGKWVENEIKLFDFEKNRLCAIEFGPGVRTKVNDATFYVKSPAGYMPFQLPVRTIEINNRPSLSYSINYSSSCNQLEFDASSSSDIDGNSISYKWIFANNKIKTGPKVTNNFPLPGNYSVTLLGTDNSGSIENSSFLNLDFVVNDAPTAIAGNDVVIPPSVPVIFDASKSFDEDGRIKFYEWNFGDGDIAEGITVSKVYKEPGRFIVNLKVTDDSESPCNYDYDSLHVCVNSAPVAKAGGDVSISVGEELPFSASESYDPDGEITAYRWDLGDGVRTGEKQFNYSYSEPGKYEVSLTVTDNSNISNRSTTDKFFVTVNHPPVAEAGRDIVAAESQEINFSGEASYDPDGEIIAYYWDFDDGNKAEGSTVTHKFSEAGIYKVVLRVVDNSGTLSDTDTDEKIIIVNNKPIAVSGQDIYQTTPYVTFDASESLDEDGQILYYEWDAGDATQRRAVSFDHVYKNPGTYTVELKVKDNTSVGNNTGVDKITVVINAKPVADAGPDVIAAPEQSINFSASNSIDSDGNISSYEWTLEGKVISTEESFSYSFENPGKYNINLKVTDNSGHSEAFDYDNILVTINKSPAAVAVDKIYAAPGDIIRLDAGDSYDEDGTITVYEWLLPDGKTITDRVLEHSFNEPGVYTVKLRVKDNLNTSNTFSSTSTTVLVNSAPIPKTKAEILTCSKIVKLSAEGSADPDGDELIYKWTLDNKTLYGKSIINEFDGHGVYPVILEVDDGKRLKNSTTSIASKVIINSAPVANAGSDLLVCSGDVVNFSAAASYDDDNDLLKYFWEFGDGESSEGLSVTNVYTKGGVYEVVLKVVDNTGLPCNYSIDKTIVTVVESPVAYAGNDITACTNSEVVFDGSGSTDSDGIVNSYSWDFGDGETGGGARTSHIYKRPGTYKVLLAIEGELVGDCDNTDTDELIVTIIDAPYANFESPDSVALGNSILFDASSSEGRNGNIRDYIWDFGDGISSSGVSTEHVFSEPGNYMVTLNITTNTSSDCRTALYRKAINVNSPPTASAGNNLVVGVGEIITLDASNSTDRDGKITSYKWDTGDGIIKEGVLINHKYISAGEYNIKLTVKDNTGLSNNSASDQLTINVNSAPVPVIKAKEFIYTGQELFISGTDTYDDDNTDLLFSWMISDGTVDSTKEFNHTFDKEGEYEIVLKVSDGMDLANSVKQISKFIRVFKPPVLKITGPSTVCLNSSSIYKVLIEGVIDNDQLVFKWIKDGKSIAENTQEINVDFNKSGLTELKLELFDIAYPNEVLSSKIYSIDVNRPPYAESRFNENVLIGGANDEVLFDASESKDPDGDLLTYEWDFGDNTIAMGKRVFHKYLNPGTYDVTLKVSDNKDCNCNSSSVLKRIKVKKVK